MRRVRLSVKVRPHRSSGSHALPSLGSRHTAAPFEEGSGTIDDRPMKSPVPNPPLFRFVPPALRRAELLGAIVWSTLILLSLAAVHAESVIPAEAGERITYRIPTAIANDCSVDVTQPISAWIASVPNHSALAFSSGACYRIEGTLQVKNRRGLEFKGNGATFKATTVGNTWRSQWRVVGGSGLTFRNMTVRGARPGGRSFAPDLQHQHGFELKGPAFVQIDRANISDAYGDCVYIGQGHDSAKSWSRNVSVHRSTCTRAGRMAVAVTAGRDVLVETSSFSNIGKNTFDIEPNGAGFGAADVTFTRNRVGPVSDAVFVALGTGPINDIAVSYNTLVGQGMKMAVRAPVGQRRSNFSIVANTSDTGVYQPGGSAMDFVRVHGLRVRQNTVPLSGPNMALAWISESCKVVVSRNRFPGGVVEARVRPARCPSAPTISSFTPTSGRVGRRIKIRGTGLTGATTVKFKGAEASFAVDSGRQIVARVPKGASTGAITVRTTGGTATSRKRFRVANR